MGENKPFERVETKSKRELLACNFLYGTALIAVVTISINLLLNSFSDYQFCINPSNWTTVSAKALECHTVREGKGGQCRLVVSFQPADGSRQTESYGLMSRQYADGVKVDIDKSHEVSVYKCVEPKFGYALSFDYNGRIKYLFPFLLEVIGSGFALWLVLRNWMQTHNMFVNAAGLQRHHSYKGLKQIRANRSSMSHIEINS